MSDDAEWGPWVDHDGKGCPAFLVGQEVQVAIELAVPDEWGGGTGHIRVQQTVVAMMDVSNPMWRFENFGRTFIYISGPMAGRDFVSGRIIRYRIHKPKALRDLIDLVENLPAPTRQPEEVA